MPSARSGPLTVSQLTSIIKQALERSIPATIHVVGQVSNFKRHGSGHLYFTLKDAFSELSCVMWRSDAAKLKFTPDDGLEVVATGGIEVFERAGRYQLYVRRLDPRGLGTLELAFRQLCEKLQREGLFDVARKKPLPRFPRRIAMVTSPTGAAIADMLRTLQRRFPCVEVLVFPVRVQGEGAAAEIAAAIRAVNANAEALGGIDVMIVGRGGGSLEDLWAFNEEIVARAVFAAKIPIVSAVGHETDVTVADLVADVRAATPTAAAEIVVPDLADLLNALDQQARRLDRCVAAKQDVAAARLQAAAHRRPLREPLLLVRHAEQSLDEWANLMQQSLSARLRQTRRHVDALEGLVQTIAPHVHLSHQGDRMSSVSQRLDRAMARSLHDLDRRVTHRALSVAGSSPAIRLHGARLEVDQHQGTLSRLMGHRLTLLAQRVQSLQDLLGAVSHESVLARGFSITRIKKDRSVLRSVTNLADRLRIVTQLADGEFESEALNVRQKELFD
ncbi:MAG: exodeoxyribonuclease VII large subunit [Planctomycetota bacterium]